MILRMASSTTSGAMSFNSRPSGTLSECPHCKHYFTCLLSYVSHSGLVLCYLGFAQDTPRLTLNCPLRKSLFSALSVVCNRVCLLVSVAPPSRNITLLVSSRESLMSLLCDLTNPLQRGHSCEVSLLDLRCARRFH
jgi:hypothetical protein